MVNEKQTIIFSSIFKKIDFLGSASSKLTDTSFQNGGLNTRRPSLTNHLTFENQNVAANYDELVGHVPIELFTVSKMVDAPATNGIVRNETFRKLSQ